MKVSTLLRHVINSSGHQCVYTLFNTLALRTRLCLATLRYHSGVCASEMCSCLILANLFYLLWCYCVIDLLKT